VEHPAFGALMTTVEFVGPTGLAVRPPPRRAYCDDNVAQSRSPATSPLSNRLSSMTAKALGLTVPDKLLALADEVIQ
jgi:hypothetical protein